MDRMSPLEFKKWLETRTRTFSVAVFKALDALPRRSSTQVISNQLGRSASSIGANYREANRAESGDDFRHKLSIALKEANESLYWLEILSELYPMHELYRKLAAEAEELLKLIQSITRSSRTKAKLQKANRTISTCNRTI